MSTKSPVSEAFHATFGTAFRPILTGLGLTVVTNKNIKPSLIAKRAARALGAEKRFEVCLWCDGKTGGNLRLRVDLIEPAGGVECTRQIDLRVPWPDPRYPKPGSLDFAGKDFLPHLNTAQLSKAIEFLAGALAVSTTPLAIAVPELASDLRALADDAEWIAAGDRATELWRTRFVR
jgi:hypothetical protein